MYKTSVGYKIFQFFNFLFMLMVIVTMLLPYIHVLVKAFNDSRDTMLGGLGLFPRIPTIDNFEIIFKDGKLLSAMLISVRVVVVCTVFHIFVQFSAAYALNKKELVGRNVILMFLMIPMFFNGGLIPNYLLFSKVGLLNNILVYILPGAFSFYNMIIIRTYMKSTISPSLEESAMLDGANELTIFWRIILPLCKPILATIALWVAVAKWNDWTTTLYYVTDSKLFTLQYKLMQLVRESESLTKQISAMIQAGENVAEIEKMMKISPESMVAAQIVVTTIPIIIVYPFLQKYFVKGVMIGAVKE